MKKIIFLSDDNELDFVRKIEKDERGKKLNEPIYSFIYTKSITKLGDTINFTETQINTMQKSPTIKIA